jgi:O-antigen/teichoic acid export membrane protein
VSNFRGIGAPPTSGGSGGVAKNVSLTFATSLLSSAATALGALVVAHQLGARGAGLFALARVVPTVAAGLLGLGITIANPYFIGGRKHPVQAIAETNLVLGVALGLAGFLAWTLAVPWLVARFFHDVAGPSILVLGAAVPVFLLRNYLNSIQQGLQAFRAANLVLFVEDLVGTLLVLPLLWNVGATDLVFIAPLAGAIASLALALLDVVRRGIRLRLRVRRALAVEMLRFGLKGYLARLANTLSWRLDMMILSSLGSIEAVGCYAVATKVAEVVRPLAGSLNFVIRPLIASLSVDEARSRGSRLLRSFFALNLVAVTVLWLTCGTVIDRLFGSVFAPAAPACRILLLGLIAFGFDGVLNGYNVGIGRPELNAYAALVGVAITVAGDLTLIPSRGLMGAAATSAVAYTAKGLALLAIFVSLGEPPPAAPAIAAGERTREAA